MRRQAVSPVLHEHDLFGDTGAAVVASLHELTGEHAPHAHDFLEIAVIGDGSGRHVSVHGKPRACRGDVFVLRPGAWHGFADCDGLIVANVCISAAALRTDLAFLRELPGLHDLLVAGPVAPDGGGVLATKVDPDSAGRAIAEISLLSELNTGAGGNRVLLLGRLLMVLGNLAGQDLGTSRTRAVVHPAVAAVIDRIESDPEHPWRLDEMAHLAGLDSAYLIRLFRRHVGLPPVAYLARSRAEKAASLLARTDLPIARVGAQVGWGDPTYFARRFRTLYGVTPTEYRRRIRITRSPAVSGRSSTGRRSRSGAR